MLLLRGPRRIGVLTAEDRRPRTHRAPTGDRRRRTAVTARREGWTVARPPTRGGRLFIYRGKASCRVVWASRPSKQPSYHCGPCLVMRRSRRLLPSRAPASCGDDDSTGHRWRGRGPHCRRRRRRRRPRRRSRGLARCPRSTAPWRAKQPEIASTALPSLSDHLRIEELRLTSPQGSFFPVAGRPRHPCLFSCGARPIRCSCSYVIAVLLGPVNLATILT